MVTFQRWSTKKLFTAAKKLILSMQYAYNSRSDIPGAVHTFALRKIVFWSAWTVLASRRCLRLSLLAMDNMDIEKDKAHIKMMESMWQIRPG